MRIRPELLNQIRDDAKRQRLTATQLVSRLIIRYFNDLELKKAVQARTYQNALVDQTRNGDLPDGQRP
jgi:hypothetical protein